MKLDKLVEHVLDKDNFLTIEDYLQFPKLYLEFIKRNLQAVIVSKNENHYQFFSTKKMEPITSLALLTPIFFIRLRSLSRFQATSSL
jgi:hypothetical protein